jgi:hypothetical protein
MQFKRVVNALTIAGRVMERGYLKFAGTGRATTTGNPAPRTTNDREAPETIASGRGATRLANVALGRVIPCGEKKPRAGSGEIAHASRNDE